MTIDRARSLQVLITGGAGFIGTRLARRLLAEGCTVTVLDNFSPQIHGTLSVLPADIAASVRLIVGDIRDASLVESALQGQDVVVHLASETGTGQSMYEVKRYEDVNVGGTAVLYDLLANGKAKSVSKVVVASSRAIYGEGAYICAADGLVYPSMRTVDAMKAGRFEPPCPVCGGTCDSAPTPEAAPLDPSSFYGITKQVQEQMTLMFARALGISGFALRYQNVYGPGQSLQNPYTGILAIFSNQARDNKPIYIFEDGNESRDFIYIDDVVEATWRAIQPHAVGVHTINVGSGQRTTVREVVDAIVAFYASQSQVTVNGAFRVGDIRHNVADLARSHDVLGFKPRWTFSDGLSQFLSWAKEQDAGGDYEASLAEMAAKGLMHG
jgi:dTDP-L-rhamnose 4-epimerase